MCGSTYMCYICGHLRSFSMWVVCVIRCVVHSMHVSASGAHMVGLCKYVK